MGGPQLNITAAAAARSTSRLAFAIPLSALALLAVWFIVRNALPYLGFSPDHYGPYFWPRRWGLLLHVVGGIAALTVGLAQLWLGLTNRTAGPHRVLGKVYVGAVGIAGIAGFYLAMTISGNVPYGTGLFTLCVAWVITTSMAVIAIRKRDVLQHREWMMRSYAVTFAFVIFRISVETLISWQGVEPRDAQGVMAWASWAVPLFLLEPFLQLRRARSFESRAQLRAR
jgi:uncharacterized membrane protein